MIDTIAAIRGVLLSPRSDAEKLARIRIITREAMERWARGD